MYTRYNNLNIITKVQLHQSQLTVLSVD